MGAEDSRGSRETEQRNKKPQSSWALRGGNLSQRDMGGARERLRRATKGLGRRLGEGQARGRVGGLEGGVA